MITEFLSKNRRTDEFWCSQLCNGNEASRKTKEDEKSIKQFLTPRTILICLFDVNEIPHNNLLLQDNEIKNILDIFRRLPGIFPGNDKKSVIVPFSTTTVFGVQEFVFFVRLFWRLYSIHPFYTISSHSTFLLPIFVPFKETFPFVPSHEVFLVNLDLPGNKITE